LLKVVNATIISLVPKKQSLQLWRIIDLFHVVMSFISALQKFWLIGYCQV